MPGCSVRHRDVLSASSPFEEVSPVSRTLSVSLSLLVVATLTACSGAAEVALPSESTRYTAGSAAVVVPGAPGEPSRTVSPGEEGTMANAGFWTEADVEFVTRMVPHHTQALEMAALAPDRASDPRVLALAERISVAQGPEIETMQAWLAEQGLPPADDGDHSHSGMEGMVSTEQMLALDAARGEEFDRLFLELMTVHHEGAIVMADATRDARHPVITEMVEDTMISQGVEIARMQELLAEL
jgi:uncharacterized protein (DUF305 family)